MKKYSLFSIIVIFLLIPCYAFSVVPKVEDLYPKNKVFGVPDKIWTVPARVVAKSSTSIARDSVALGLTKSIAGGIVTSLAIAGVGYVGNRYIDWLMDQDPPMYYAHYGKGKYYALDGKLMHDVLYTGYGPAQDLLVAAHALNVIGPNYGACSTIDYICYSTENTCSYSGSGWVHSDVTLYGYLYHLEIYILSQDSPYCKHLAVVYECQSQLTSTVPTVVTHSDLYSEVSTAIDGITDENAPMALIVNDAIDKAADIVNNGAGIAAAPGTVAADLEARLNLAIPPSVATDLENALADPVAVDEALNESVQSVENQKSISSAVSNALQNFFGPDVPPPVDPELAIPEKRSLTGILESFYNSISNLPIMATLNGIAVTASGTPDLCVNLPADFGGTRCWSAAGNQSDINMIGSAMLAVVSILSVIYVFRGA